MFPRKMFSVLLCTDDNVITTTFADDTAILAVRKELNKHVKIIQNNVNKIETARLNSAQITFTKCHGVTPTVSITNKHINTTDCIKYVGLHLYKRQT